MARCDVCGNDYPNSFDVVTADGKKLSFDSFECAIHRLAPACSHCGCRIIGHGIQGEGEKDIYCCASCARHGGETQAVDNTRNVPG